MRKLTLLAIVLMVALVAVPAFASVQNVKVSGSIDSTWLYRDNFDLGQSTNNIEDINQNTFLTQTTLRVDADLTDQVATTVELINERTWGDDNVNPASDVNLNLAYVTLREMLYSPLTVVVGRQKFAYGNSLIINSNGTNNAAPADSGIVAVADDLTKQGGEDAIRLIFDYNPLALEVLYSKIAENTNTSGFDQDSDDVDLYGLNATYELGDDMNTQVESYLFARIDKNVSTGAGTVNNKDDTTYVPGLRASADILEGLNIQGEVAWQKGNDVLNTGTTLDHVERDAMAMQFLSNYQIPASVLPDALEKYNPALSYGFTRVSGDSNPTTDRSGLAEASADVNTAWDPMYEAQSGGKIYNALYNLTNVQVHEVAATVKPIEDVTTKVTWSGLWLDKDLNAATVAAGVNGFTLVRPDTAAGTSTPTVVADETGLGWEIDWDTTYDYTEDVQIGASFGWFNPGAVYAAVNDSTASQAIIHGNVNF